jgi:hypothetical protein
MSGFAAGRIVKAHTTRGLAWLSCSAAVALAFAAASPAHAQSPAPPPLSFGSPPSGEIPILFNDHHLYAKPDRLKQGRVLAALANGSTVLIPLRTMLEMTGATVSYDPANKTVDVTKPGSDIKLTVGVTKVILNGTTRPLDVAPMIYHGTVLVPLRVVSEAMGAYVEWIAEKRLVIVRYLTGEPPPPATPIPSPAPAATQSPPPPKPAANQGFVSAAYLVSPKVYNELSPGNIGSGSYLAHAAVEIGSTLKSMIEGDFRSYLYQHNANQISVICAVGTAGCNTLNTNGQFQTGTCPAPDPGCVTVPGAAQLASYTGRGQAYVNALSAQETSFDVHIALKIFDPRVYAGIGYYSKHYAQMKYPAIGGFGGGISKLPDLEKQFSLYGSAWYYPSVTGTYTYPTTVYLGPLSGQSIQFGYSIWKYALGGALDLGRSGLFIDAGLAGEYASAKSNTPGNTSMNSAYLGLGWHP